ncbi:unnamed protein product [Cochlearia groenlandica]
MPELRRGLCRRRVTDSAAPNKITKHPKEQKQRKKSDGKARVEAAVGVVAAERPRNSSPFACFPENLVQVYTHVKYNVYCYCKN